jgi:hypothetical protein
MYRIAGFTTFLNIRADAGTRLGGDGRRPRAFAAARLSTTLSDRTRVDTLSYASVETLPSFS